MSKAYCINCDKKVDWKTRTHIQQFSVRNISFLYEEYTAYCAECGEEIYVPEINDLNVKQRYEACEDEI